MKQIKFTGYPVIGSPGPIISLYVKGEIDFPIRNVAMSQGYATVRRVFKPETNLASNYVLVWPTMCTGQVLISEQFLAT